MLIGNPSMSSTRTNKESIIRELLVDDGDKGPIDMRNFSYFSSANMEKTFLAPETKNVSDAHRMGEREKGKQTTTGKLNKKKTQKKERKKEEK